jgi:hypothetical protein
MKRVPRAVRARATRTGKRESEVVEESLRRTLGLDLLDRASSRNENLAPDEPLWLAVEASTSRAARFPRPAEVSQLSAARPSNRR